MRLASLTLAAAFFLGAETFTGVITDSMCGTNHDSMNVSPVDKCVRECMKHGKDVKYILWTGSKAYKLSDQQTPEKFAAQKVKVTGKLYPKTGIIAVESIEPAK
jgi:hypothetical protein